MTALTKIVTIQNKKGLHARAAAKFVKVAASFGAETYVTRMPRDPEAEPNPEWTVIAISILGLMMLGAEPGTQLLLKSEGEDAQAVLDGLAELVNDLFGEGE